MTSIFKKILFLLLFSVFIVGCGNEGPMESAGKAVDEAVEDTGEAIDDAAENVEDAIEEKQKELDDRPRLV